MQNLEFVNLKCITYAQPIPLPLSWIHINSTQHKCTDYDGHDFSKCTIVFVLIILIK